MKVIKRPKEGLQYKTWYEFKQDLEKHLGHSILNWDWIEVKPKAPLPWDESHMHAVFSGLARLAEQKAVRKWTRNIQL